MVEKFDIEQFNKYKVNGSYERVLDDGTRISEYGDPSEYYANIIPPTGWFYTYKEFYGNGQLKAEGKLFKKGDFRSGLWKEYDERGNVAASTDYDAPYKLKVESVIDILARNGVLFSVNNKFDELSREVQDSKPVWVADWLSKTRANWVERAVIDDANGKIIKKDGYTFKKN